MASASVATTVSVKPGVRARLRAECLKSLIHDSTAFTCHLVDATGRTSSRLTSHDARGGRLLHGVGKNCGAAPDEPKQTYTRLIALTAVWGSVRQSRDTAMDAHDGRRRPIRRRWNGSQRRKEPPTMLPRDWTKGVLSNGDRAHCGMGVCSAGCAGTSAHAQRAGSSGQVGPVPGLHAVGVRPDGAPRRSDQAERRRIPSGSCGDHHPGALAHVRRAHGTGGWRAGRPLSAAGGSRAQTGDVCLRAGEASPHRLVPRQHTLRIVHRVRIGR